VAPAVEAPFVPLERVAEAEQAALRQQVWQLLLAPK
jgi:hypothetical protein